MRRIRHRRGQIGDVTHEFAEHPRRDCISHAQERRVANAMMITLLLYYDTKKNLHIQTRDDDDDDDDAKWGMYF